MNNWFRLGLACSIALIIPSMASAQLSPNLSSKFVSCLSRAGSNVVQQSVCSQTEAGAQDDRLNKSYQRVMHQLSNDPTAKTTLRMQQRAWIEQRDYQCKINGETVNETCLVEKTAGRADELESRVRF